MSGELEKEAFGNQLLNYLSRHLVALATTYQPIDPEGRRNNDPGFACYSGFILPINGNWFFVTAGHILEQLDSHLNAGNVLCRFRLVDYLRNDADQTEPIPFDYENADRMWRHADGLDFGFVALDGPTKRQLEANGVRPLYQEYLEPNDGDTLHGHIMLGLPEEFFDDPQFDDTLVIGGVSPALIPIERLESALEGATNTTHERFVGRLSDELEIHSIVGMSGGPTFGFGHDAERHLCYWLVAIQSAWHLLPVGRITFGCPVDVFLRVLMEAASHSQAGNDLPEIDGADG